MAPLPGIEYWFVERGAVRVHKTGATTSSSTTSSGDCRNFDRREVSGADWMSWDEGLARLTFDNEREVGVAARRLHEEAG